MKRNYKSGAEKIREKKKRDETSTTSSKLLSAWLHKPRTDGNENPLQDKEPICNDEAMAPTQYIELAEGPSASDADGLHQTPLWNNDDAITRRTEIEKSSILVKDAADGGTKDISTWVSSPTKLSFGERFTALSEVWTPEVSFKFPGSGTRNLRFQLSWLHRFKWLAYSKQDDGAYCKCCVLFSPDGVGVGCQPLGQLVKTKYNRWKNAIEDFSHHERNDYHKKCVQQSISCQQIANKKQDPVNLQVDSGLKKQIEENRKKIKPIIETIIFCGRQNIPLRGHRDHGPIDVSKEPIENDGNFRALLRFRVSSGDETLKNHLQTSCNNAMYISPHTQNVLISCCSDFIVKHIVSKVNLAKCFTVLADETTDIAGIQQMSLGVRYFDTEAEKIKEDFLQFVPIKDSTGRGLAKDILNTLSKLGVDMTHMRGQGYDGASAMSGDFNGVQAVVRESYPLALYMHCSSHVLNLAVSNACDIKSIRNCLGIINSVYTFHVSSKRLNILQESIESKVPGSNKTRLKAVCPTRWVERHDCVSVFMELFDAVIDSLFKISQWHDREAASNANLLLCSIQSSEFIVSVHVVKTIFSITAPLSRLLQSEHLDLANAMSYATAVEERLLTLREHAEEEFKKIYEQVQAKADSLEIEVRIPRLAGLQTQRCNVESRNPEDYFRIAVFIPFLDGFIQQLQSRFINHKGILKSFQSLLPRKENSKISEENEMEVKQLVDKYTTDVGCSEDAALGEISVWYSYVNQQKKYPKSAVEALSMCDKNTLPAVHTLLKIFATLPVTTATSERSFSTLRRLKSYLRNTTNETRLNGLALLNVHREIFITTNDVLDEFSLKPHRIDFVL